MHITHIMVKLSHDRVIRANSSPSMVIRVPVVNIITRYVIIGPQTLFWMILSAILGGYLYYKAYSNKIGMNYSYNFGNHINAVQ